MKKQVLLALAAMTTLGVTTAFATDIYDDVPRDHWAYQAVVELTEAGIVEGYPDGSFAGERNITRYEMTQMIANAMKNVDKANPMQQAQINHLVSEFANDLRDMDSRLTAVEDRLEKFTVSGEANVYYNQIKFPKFKGRLKELIDNVPTNGSLMGPEALIARIPSTIDDDVYANISIGVQANISDNMNAYLQVTTSDYRLGDNNHIDLDLEQAYLNYRLNNMTLTGGRMPQTLGTGYYFGSEFDGIRINKGNDKTKFELGFGRFQNLYSGNARAVLENFGNGQLLGLADKFLGTSNLVNHLGNNLADFIDIGGAPKTWFAQVSHEFKPGLEAKIFYLDTIGNVDYKTPILAVGNLVNIIAKEELLNEDMAENISKLPNLDYVETYGIAITAPIGNMKLSAEWGQNNSKIAKAAFNGYTLATSAAITGEDELMQEFSDNFLAGKVTGSSPQYWLVRLDLRESDMAVKGSYGLYVDYKDFEIGSYFGGTGTDYDDLYYTLGTKFWTVGASYVPVENMELSAHYTFGGKLHGPVNEFAELGDQFRAQLKYRF